MTQCCQSGRAMIWIDSSGKLWSGAEEKKEIYSVSRQNSKALQLPYQWVSLGLEIFYLLCIFWPVQAVKTCYTRCRSISYGPSPEGCVLSGTKSRIKLCLFVCFFIQEPKISKWRYIWTGEHWIANEINIYPSIVFSSPFFLQCWLTLLFTFLSISKPLTSSLTITQPSFSHQSSL